MVAREAAVLLRVGVKAGNPRQECPNPSAFRTDVWGFSQGISVMQLNKGKSFRRLSYDLGRLNVDVTRELRLFFFFFLVNKERITKLNQNYAS